MPEILIATRRYDLDGYSCVDRMMRVGEAFSLKRSVGGHPQEADDEVSYDLAGCFVWFRDAPWQIDRTV